jgi:hypothetical protein
MRILLDECVPRPLLSELPGHDAQTVSDMGWSGKANGDLLRLMAASGFEVFLTVDQNLLYQQNLHGAPVAIVLLVALQSRLPDLLPLMPKVRAALATIRLGQVVEIRA